MNSKVSELLTKINTLVTTQASAPLSALEFDLLQQYIRELYVQTNEQQLLFNQPKTVVERVKETKYEPLLVTKPIVQTPSEPQVEKSTETAPITTLQTTHIAPPQETTIKQQPEEKHSEETKAANTTVSLNEVSKTSTSINEKWVNPNVEIHKKLASKPLRELIDFNKRFAIVNELFKGDTAKFQQTINAIDEAVNYDQAETIYLELTQSQAWDTTAQTTRLFNKLIKQRFGVE